MKSEFRETSPADAAEVGAFLQRIFEAGPGMPFVAERNLYWKSWEPRADWEGSRGYAITREGGIVAHATVVPLNYVIGEQRIRMAHLIDWAADPKAVGSGVKLLKVVMQIVDAIIAVGGSEMTQKVLPALGFKTCGETTRFARPLRPLKRLAGGKPSVRAGAQFARSMLWSLKGPGAPAAGWTASRVEPGQPAWQALQWPRGQNKVALFERTAECMEYFLKCPVAPIWLYAVAKDAVARGYFMLAHTPGQVRIADFYVDSEEPKDWRSLLQLAVAEARRDASAAEVVSLGSDSVTRQALKDSGFHERGDLALRILARPGVNFPEAAIRFQLIDYDGAYMHDNQKSYWS